MNTIVIGRAEHIGLLIVINPNLERWQVLVLVLIDIDSKDKHLAVSVADVRSMALTLLSQTHSGGAGMAG
jgi:hypothetical protein